MEAFLIALYAILSFIFYLLPLIVVIAGITQLKKRKKLGITMIALGVLFASVAFGIRIYYSFFF